MSCHDPNNAFSVCFGNTALLAYVPPTNPYSSQKRVFCSLDNIHCIFLGGLNNLCNLIKQYRLSKGTNEAMFVVEAYRTLHDRGLYPADQVLKDLDRSFGFVIYDTKAGTVFAALVVISDNLGVMKQSCAKSFAPFPTEQGLMSFEHPTKKMKAMHRVDSEGFMCGATFKVDVQSRIPNMPRVGSEANWAAWGLPA
ncbi:stem-specific protein TSJT1-like [Pyrus ussuriensis x Pyrus communis]|uniref:Stem-specific protein TSJT1-like n=1 Tax=Pyrus ussuriensis x Pyrus communis TaxID=2448454 RepID=A0A5N5FWF7_9ROSA|nr:stem-specific protein TSJT1-like [Pyrus ussuriensis x Pyrus communis]